MRPRGYGNRLCSPTTPFYESASLLPPPEAVYAARHEYCQFTWWRNVRFSPNLAALHSFPCPPPPSHLFLSLSLSLSPIADPRVTTIATSLSFSLFFFSFRASLFAPRGERFSLPPGAGSERREKRGGRQEKARGGQQKRRAEKEKRGNA